MRRVKGMRGELAAVERDLKRRVPNLITKVSDRDEMLKHVVDSCPGPPDEDPGVPSEWGGPVRVFPAVRSSARAAAGARTGSILDFACGCGRVTRWMVTTCGAGRVSASDIDPHAVDFVHKTFGVSGFTSTANARDLPRAGPCDAILVVSLFSHLTLDIGARGHRSSSAC